MVRLMVRCVLWSEKYSIYMHVCVCVYIYFICVLLLLFYFQVNTCVYLNKKIEFCAGSIRCQVYEMWSMGDRVACGVITDDTKVREQLIIG